MRNRSGREHSIGLHSSALRITAFYIFLGGLWIVLSDGVLGLLVQDPEKLTAFSTYKGWAFVAVSGIVLYSFLGREFTRRERAEKELLNSEAAQRQLVESARDVIFAIAPDTTIISLNPAFQAITGWPMDGWIGRSFSDLVYPEDLFRVLGHFSSALAGATPAMFEARIFTKERGLIVAEIAITPRRQDSQVIGVLGIGRDVTENRRTEQALAESKRRLDRFFSYSPSVIYALSVEGKSIRASWVSENVSRLYGYEPAEVLESAWWFNHLHPSDRPKTLNHLERIFREESFSQDYRLRRKDGVYRWVLDELQVRKNSGGEPVEVIGAWSDITERKEAEAIVAATEARFRTLVEQSLFGLYIIKENRFVYVNPQFAGMFGCTPEEIRQLPSILELVSETDRALVSENIRKRVSGEVQSVRYTFSGRRKDGTEVFVEVHGTKVRINEKPAIIGSALDVTSQKRSEEALKKSESYLKLIIDSSLDMIIAVDLNRCIRQFNKAAERTFGYQAEEVRGQSVDFLFADPEQGRAVFQETLLHGVCVKEVQSRRENGEIFPRYLAGSRMQNPDGAVIGLVGISRDITELKLLEKKFLRAQRLESIGTLSGGIAHDLNNILAPILMSSEILAMQNLDAETRKMLGTIQKNARRGAEIVQQVLTFARGTEGRRICLQLKHLIREVQGLVRETFPKAITTRSNIAGDLWPVLGDSTQLHQVLLNLAVNARDAMPDGGTLGFKAQNFHSDALFAGSHPPAKEGDYVRLEISDTGVGIAPEILDKIFDPFFTTKEPGRGTGLGLSTVLGIVKSHGGLIDVESKAGAGTTFTIFLPVSRGKPVTLSDSPAPDTFQGNGELILVVDDEPRICESTKKLLEAYGYSVVTAKDGTEAMVVFLQKQHDISVVLTDIMMPVMDGIALIRLLCNVDPTVKIIACSGHGQSLEVEPLGIKSFLAKPYETEELLSLLSELVGGSYPMNASTGEKVLNKADTPAKAAGTFLSREDA